jgi:hypothetical protein
MTVGGERQRYLETLTGGVCLRLLETVHRRQVFGLGLDQGHGDGLALGVDPNTQDVINTPTGTPARAAVNDLDGAGRLLAADQILGPASRVKGRVDELRPSVGLAERHCRWEYIARKTRTARPCGRAAVYALRKVVGSAFKR